MARISQLIKRLMAIAMGLKQYLGGSKVTPFPSGGNPLALEGPKYFTEGHHLKAFSTAGQLIG